MSDISREATTDDDPADNGPAAGDTADTTNHRIVRAQPYQGRYVELTDAPGEPHVARDELAPGIGDDPTSDWTPSGGPLLSLAQLTDFQLADLISPARTDYLQRRSDDPRWTRMTPSYRPEEFLELHAIEGVAASIREFAEQHHLDVTVTTGDNTDSAQHNELATYMRLVTGGPVDPTALGVGHPSSPTGLADDPAYSHPSGTAPDEFTDRGVPRRPGADAAAAKPFTATGVGTPWLTVYGNHDALVQGRATGSSLYSEYVQGNRKPVEPPAGYEPADEALVDFVADPMVLTGGPSIPVPADPDRRVLDREAYVKGHLAADGLPVGHGFSELNAETHTAYYVWDAVPGMRIITLDTNNAAGFWDGALNDGQFTWLAERLAEVSADSDDPRLVIIAAHHGLSTLTNGYRDAEHHEELHLADDVEALLHRHPQVIAWISGHTHVNLVTPRPADGQQSSPGGGFVEFSTAAVSEWPVQWRHLEVRIAPRGAVIRSTIHDSAAPLHAESWQTPLELASLHRAVAANDPDAVGGLEAQGSARDRNVIVHVPLPPELVSAVLRASLTRD